MKLVKESLNEFERGLNPKATLGFRFSRKFRVWPILL